MVKKLTFAIIFGLYTLGVNGQCAMCRATLENNVSNGEAGIAAGMNFGILYLFAMPYLLILTIAILWYRNSKRQKS